MKILIVTGGSGGLGTAVVARLEQEYRCVLLRRPETDVLDGGSVREALARAVEAFGAPYGLVHMVGGFEGGKLSETSDETWQRMIGLNLTSAFLVVRETLARMSRDEPGRIVAISSEATLTKSAGAAAYAIAKTGLNTLIESTAAELRGSRITANALLPSTLDTPASRESMPKAKRVPLERVADSILFLLSDAASSVNGALIPLR